jgi:hypothetical protein
MASLFFFLSVCVVWCISWCLFLFPHAIAHLTRFHLSYTFMHPHARSAHDVDSGTVAMPTQEGIVRTCTGGPTLSPAAFYGVYHGHDVDHLSMIFDELVTRPRANAVDVHVVWLAGDSSLDNKYWIGGPGSRIPATNGMERVLSPPSSVADIAAHMNDLLSTTHDNGVPASSAATTTTTVCINCSVEESTVSCRKRGTALLPQDVFLKEHLQPGDAVIISLGGNDIALSPKPATICSMGWLTKCSSPKNITKGTAWGLGVLQSLVVGDLSAYLKVILTNLSSSAAAPSAQSSKKTPTRKSVVLPCVIYYPDQNPKSESWANRTLGAIGYDKNPQHVHKIIDRIAAVAASTITSESLGIPKDTTHVEVIPLSAALDGTRSEDYVARVEPSATGGRRIAELVWNSMRKAW